MKATVKKAPAAEPTHTRTHTHSNKYQEKSVHLREFHLSVPPGGNIKIRNDWHLTQTNLATHFLHISYILL